MALAKKSGAAERSSFAKIKEIIPIPNLIEVQRRSFDQFLQMKVSPHAREEIGLQGVFTSIFPIFDYDDSASLEFVKFEFGSPKYSAEECREKGMTFSVPLKVTLRLVVWDKQADSEARSIRDIKEQEVYLGEMPVMTAHGTFIINGTERVVVSQLHRSPGVFFDHDGGKTHPSGKTLYSARLIPYRGSWLEFDFDGSDVLHVRVDRRRKFLATILLRAIGYSSNEQILSLFYERDVIHVQKGKELLIGVNSPGATSFRVSRDISDPHSRQPILGATKRITKAAQKRLQALKVAHVPLYKEDVIGRIAAADIVNPKTGEVILECAHEITEDSLEQILKSGIRDLAVLSSHDGREVFDIRETILRDSTRSEKEALTEIYRRMRPGDPPTRKRPRRSWSPSSLTRGATISPRSAA